MLLDSPLVCWLQPWYRISYIRVSIVLGDTSTSQYITINIQTLNDPHVAKFTNMTRSEFWHLLLWHGIFLPAADSLIYPYNHLNHFWFLLILAREIPAGIYYYYFSLWYANYSHDVTYQTSRSLQLWEIPLHPNTYTNYPNTCGWLCDANFPNTLTTISDLYPHLGMSFVMLIFPIHQQLSLIVYSLCC